jgi:hypothetical protein
VRRLLLVTLLTCGACHRQPAATVSPAPSPSAPPPVQVAGPVHPIGSVHCQDRVHTSTTCCLACNRMIVLDCPLFGPLETCEPICESTGRYERGWAYWVRDARDTNEIAYALDYWQIRPHASCNWIRE